MRLDSEAMGNLYGRYRDGGPLSDAEWLGVNGYVDWFVARAVGDAAKKWRIPEHTWNGLITDVGANVLAKFIERKLPPPSHAGGIQALLRVVTGREIISALRKVRGVLAGHSEGLESSECPRPGPDAPGHGDEFEMVRTRLGPFRFPDQHLAREILLAELLMTGRYPAPSALQSFCSQVELNACFNAAVYDINDALCELRGAAVA